MNLEQKILLGAAAIIAVQVLAVAWMMLRGARKRKRMRKNMLKYHDAMLEVELERQERKPRVEIVSPEELN